MNTTGIANQLPITNLLSKFDFESLRDELNRKVVPEDEQSDKYYHINMKETDELCILYYNNIVIL